MSAITVEGDLIHYEVLGRGRPVILVHGWLGSWRYWIPAMSQLSLKYRTYAIDLWGFGDSGKDPRHYDFASQVSLIDQFMTRMGIAKAALIGHDLGAAVVAHFAMTQPDRVPRMMAVSPPLFRLSPGTPLITSTPEPPPAAQPVTPPAAPPAAVKPPDPPITVKPVSPAIPAASVPSPAETLLKSPFRAAPQLPNADTIPARTDEMKTRLQQAALEAQKAGGLASPTPAAPQPPKPGDGASQPSSSSPSPTQVSRNTPPAQVPPGAPPSVTPPPAAPAASTPDAESRLPNPLRDHLDVLDPVTLLEKHVDAGADLEKLRVEVNKADKMAVARSVTSFAGVDTLRDLARLTVPAIAVYGTNDTFLPPPDSEMIARLKEGRDNFQLIGLESGRHFPMLENIETFTRLLLDFLELPNVTDVEIKKKWERRVR
ncbi:MAG TPA: alpha/beta fold hydrolase [Aggregatilinea sp.]|uniref:alpha/beta hydrolase n=1 Tax=Aggregatilinea sp. TaxID=2806333 RepID=UPI002BD4E09A|nr:alpha/beta fold hydrolase [Aggregatilinea sp.]HML23394.1 alpha/beta fold hydrolase [Aggregatilinea sp.]